MSITTTRLEAAAMTPAQIDTLWLPLLEKIDRVETWIAMDRKQIKDPDTMTYYLERAKESLAEHLAERQRLVNEADPFAEQWSVRGGWVRYFLVKNNNGHYHRDRNCSTCFDTTQYGIVPVTSGLTEAEMVDMTGTDACTVCFPWAPSTEAWKNGVSMSKTERDQKRAAATELRVAKAQKKVDHWTRRIASLNARLAKTEFRDTEAAYELNHASQYLQDAQQALAEASAEPCECKIALAGSATYRGYSAYGTCEACGARVGMTQTYRLRAHNRKVAA